MSRPDLRDALDDPELTDPSIAPSWTANGMSLPRIMSLSDGVFAIAITILAVNIRIPDLGDAPDAGTLRHTLIAMWPSYLSYVLSFVVIGIYWIAHHNIFHHIRRSDRTLLWLNLFFLMFASFIPFSAALLGRYWHYPSVLVAYGLTLLLTGLVLEALLAYVIKRGLTTRAARSTFPTATVLILLVPAVSVVSIAVAFFSPRASLVMYAVVPVLYIWPSRVDRGWQRVAQVAYERELARLDGARAEKN